MNEKQDVPEFYSFVKMRREHFGGFIFNPYLSNELTLNQIGYRIVELCDGHHTIEEITKSISNRFGLSLQKSQEVVEGAFKKFKEHSLVNWRAKKSEKRDDTKRLEPVLDAFKSFQLLKNLKGNYYSAPVFVFWDITYDCNLKCKQCLANAGQPLIDELNLREVKRIVKEIVDMDIFRIALMGGEPLLRKDIYDIMECISEYDLAFTFSTNGYVITEKIINKLEPMNVFDIQVSIDGLKETHDYLRGVNGSFDRAVSAVKMFLDANYHVSISTTISNQNINELEDLMELARSLGVDSYKAIPFLPAGRGKQYGKDLSLTAQQIKDYTHTMIKKKKEFGNDFHVQNEGAYAWLLEDSEIVEDIPSNFKVGCTAGTTSLVISPNGNIFPCPFLHDFVAGDLRKESLSDVWDNSVTFSIFRDIEMGLLKGQCHECEYLPRTCSGGCRAAAYAHSKDIYGEDPHCWKKCK